MKCQWSLPFPLPLVCPLVAATVALGIRLRCSWSHWGNKATFGLTCAKREPLRHRYPNGPYSMIGPVETTGAAPGDTVECTLIALSVPVTGAGTRSRLG